MLGRAPTSVASVSSLCPSSPKRVTWYFLQPVVEMDIGEPDTEREIEIVPLEEPVPTPAPAPVEKPEREPVRT